MDSKDKEALLIELSEAKTELNKLLDDVLNYDKNGEFESANMLQGKHSLLRDRIQQLERDIYEIEMEDFRTRLIYMNLDEIKEEYIELLETRKSYIKMADDGFEVDSLEWKRNDDLIEMFEKHIKANPELSELEELSLEEISIEDLAKLEEEMDREINDNNEKIKQAQIDRILAKQQIIREQRKTLEELENQGINLDD